MTVPEWLPEWARLDQFHLPTGADRLAVAEEWFRQLQHHPVAAVHDGITDLIGSTPDTFLPGLGKLRELIRARSDRTETPESAKCFRCHGSRWIDADPFLSNGLVYANTVIRCPECGVPPPTLPPSPYRRALTPEERAAWDAGQARDTMPSWAKAKKTPQNEAAREQHRTAMREAFGRLHLKLFPGGRS